MGHLSLSLSLSFFVVMLGIVRRSHVHRMTWKNKLWIYFPSFLCFHGTVLSLPRSCLLNLLELGSLLTLLTLNTPVGVPINTASDEASLPNHRPSCRVASNFSRGLFAAGTRNRIVSPNSHRGCLKVFNHLCWYEVCPSE